jgi:hypothetical protein
MTSINNELDGTATVIVDSIPLTPMFWFKDSMLASAFIASLQNDNYHANNDTEAMNHYNHAYKVFNAFLSLSELTVEDASNILMSLANEHDVKDTEHDSILPAGIPGSVISADDGKLIIMSWETVTLSTLNPTSNDLRHVGPNEDVDTLVGAAERFLIWNNWEHAYTPYSPNETKTFISKYQHAIRINDLYEDISGMDYTHRVRATRELIRTITVGA